MVPYSVEEVYWFKCENLEPLWDNLGLTLRNNFFLDCHEARGPIYLMFVSLDLLTTLKRGVIASKGTIYLYPSSFLGIFLALS